MVIMRATGAILVRPLGWTSFVRCRILCSQSGIFTSSNNRKTQTIHFVTSPCYSPGHLFSPPPRVAIATLLWSSVVSFLPRPCRSRLAVYLLLFRNHSSPSSGFLLRALRRRWRLFCYFFLCGALIKSNPLFHSGDTLPQHLSSSSV